MMFILERILFADDFRFMRTHLKRTLHEANFQKIIVENVVQAIGMYKIHSPEIVILNITIPSLNGIMTLLI